MLLRVLSLAIVMMFPCSASGGRAADAAVSAALPHVSTLRANLISPSPFAAPVVVLTNAQVHASMKNPKSAQAVALADTAVLRQKSDVGQLLSHLQRPSQLNTDYFYVLEKKTHQVTTHLKPSTTYAKGHAHPMSYLTFVDGQVWADYRPAAFAFDGHSYVRANCFTDWWGILPSGWCIVVTVGDLFNESLAQTPFSISNLNWGSAQAQADPEVLFSGTGLYKMIGVDEWASTEDAVFWEFNGEYQVTYP